MNLTAKQIDVAGYLSKVLSDPAPYCTERASQLTDEECDALLSLRDATYAEAQKLLCAAAERLKQEEKERAEHILASEGADLIDEADSDAAEVEPENAAAGEEPAVEAAADEGNEESSEPEAEADAPAEEETAAEEPPPADPEPKPAAKPAVKPAVKAVKK